MLILKNFIHILFFLKNQKNCVFILILYITKKNIDFLISQILRFNCYFKKKNQSSFFFRFKISTLNRFFFNRVILKLFDTLKTLDLKVIFKFNMIKKKRNTHTVLRSPFVYKSSREQFFFENFKGILTLSVKNKKGCFLIEYIESILFKALSFPFVFKIIIKKVVKA